MPVQTTVTAPEKRLLHEANVVYCYDGSFEGFLTCVFESFEQHELPFAVWPPERETPSFYPIKRIETDSVKAQRVFRSLTPKLGAQFQEMVMVCSLSGFLDKELLLIRFLHFAFSKGPSALAMGGNVNVGPVLAMRKNISREIEKLMGFIRFEESNGMLGAVIHPKNYVLPLLRHHFCSRYPEETFLIYDATHSAVLFYHDHKAEITQLDQPLTLPEPDEKEAYYQSLWRQYYRTMEITERHNETCRRNLCPKRYWADMTELRDAV